MRTPGMRRTACAALIVLSVVAAACSGDDDADPTTPTTPSTAPTTAPETTTLGTAPDVAAATFTFGVVEPGAGLLADVAAGLRTGLAVALEDINAAGGVLGGPATAFEVTEDADEPLAAAFDELAARGADAILGPVGSDRAIEAAGLAREQQLLVCSPSATAASVTADGDAARFFRTAMRDDDAAATVAQRIMAPTDDRDAPGTVLVLGRDDRYGTELAGDLAAQFTARGAVVDTLLYPARRVDFDEEVAAVLAAAPDVLVLAAFEEGRTIVTELAAAGFPLDAVVGLDGMADPALAEQLFPDEPERADGLRAIRSTGDRLLTQRLLAAAEDGRTLYGAQMYDCAVTIALAAIAAGRADPVDVGAQIQRVTSAGWTCSTFAHCRALLDAGEDIAYSGPSGGLEIGDFGDISTARLTTSIISDGAWVDVATDRIDLVEVRRQQLLAAAVVTTQLQQLLKFLGHFGGDVTGVFDDETAEAVRSLQRELGVAETGFLDEETDAALRARLGGAGSALHLAVSQLQLELQALGYYDGPIDGRHGAATIAAIRAFQARLGVPPTGLLDATTLRAIFALGQQSPLQPPPPPPEPAPEATTTTAAPAPPPVTPAPAPPTTATPSPPPPPPATPAPAPPTTVAPAPPTTEPEPPATTVVPEPERPTMLAALAADGRYATLLGLLRTAGFEHDLSRPAPPFTVLAPTDAAFEAMDPDERQHWTQDPGRLAALLAHHAIDPDEGVLAPGDFRNGSLRSMHGAPLDVHVAGSSITVNGANLGPPTDASNGVVYALDGVLVPPP